MTASTFPSAEDCKVALKFAEMRLEDSRAALATAVSGKRKNREYLMATYTGDVACWTARAAFWKESLATALEAL